MRMILFAALSTILTAPVVAADAQGRLPPDRAPSLMTSTEIRTYNEGLDAAHPYYIRCKKDPVVGSLVRKLRVCRTNAKWKRFAEQGSDSAREILGDVTTAPVSGTPVLEGCPANRC